MKTSKLFRQIESNPRNVDFRDLVKVVEAFGYVLERTSGSHHMFRHPEIRQKLNLQPQGKSAKSYQVRQFLKDVERYNLQLKEIDE